MVTGSEGWCDVCLVALVIVWSVRLVNVGVCRWNSGRNSWYSFRTGCRSHVRRIAQGLLNVIERWKQGANFRILLVLVLEDTAVARGR